MLVVPVAAAFWLRRRPWYFAAATAGWVFATLPFWRHGFVLQTVQLVVVFLAVAPLAVLAATGTKGAFGRSPLRIPAVAGWVVLAVAVAALYWSGQYRDALAHPAVWQLTQVELLGVGVAFAWPVLGPGRVAIGWRVAYVMFGILYWSVVGLALESQHSRLAPGVSAAALHAGAGDLWTITLLASLLYAVLLLFEWLYVDLGRARNADRHNADEDARQLALWRAARREAGLADVRARESVVVRSRPAGSDRSERSFRSARWVPPADAELPETPE